QDEPLLALQYADQLARFSLSEFNTHRLLPSVLPISFRPRNHLINTAVAVKPMPNTSKPSDSGMPRRKVLIVAISKKLTIISTYQRLAKMPRASLTSRWLNSLIRRSEFSASRRADSLSPVFA